MTEPAVPEPDLPEPDLPGSGPPDLRLDCLGLRCPRPVIELARRIGEVPVTGRVELLADDPAAGPDVAAWCRMRGHSLLSSDGGRHLVRRDH